MVIMAILLTLAGFAIAGSRANARDAQRAANVDTVARGLEVRYTNGNSTITNTGIADAGTYPSIIEIQHIKGQTVSSFSPTSVTGGYGPTALPGTTVESFSTVPATTNYAGLVPICTTLAGCSAITAENKTSTTIVNFPATSGMLYEPINASGTICYSGDCVRFNLYWHKETEFTTLQSYRSKHQ